MRFTVQYIPLSQIKPGSPAAVTERMKQVRRLMGDCMHVIAVLPNRGDGTYSLLAGRDRYDYLTNHTKKKYAPCIVVKRRFAQRRHPLASAAAKLLALFARGSSVPGPAPASWAIIRAFLKAEPRFRQLPRLQQWKVLLLAVRYRQTVVALMRLAVDRYAHERERTSE
ncbi:hypothetical protein SD70_06180 [Gordoniibacillus kamchatkensis]|uniref:ParB/Sulfiredoxin domain-containing protein n=1 Tax=Gordoniibacillus kamchatkensis TaxID=1590651 RepID=A0ABR5AL11_9BACL|nr:hypothetical protein [Paenibacillus sp. VKM B-2647]KIL41478.1 hypothetical protein SD70_06180 [Paenibacillus sp. VKM B-2647]